MTGWLTLFVIGTDLFVVSPLLPLIAAEFRLSPTMAGLCASLFSATYMVSAPVLGGLADRFGRRRILVICLAAFALANLLTGTAASFAWLLAWRCAAAAAAAGVTPSVYAAVGDDAPPARRATWMAVAVSGLLLALSAGAPIGALIGARWGWRAPFLVLAVTSLALAVGNRAVRPADLPAVLPSRPAAVALGLPLMSRLAPTVLWATALYGVYTYLGLGLAAGGSSPPQVARTISLYGLAALAGALLGGHIADRIGMRRTMLYSLVGLATCLAALGIALRAGWPVDAIVMLASVLAQLFFPAQQAALSTAFPDRRAGVLAWNNSALFFGIALGGLIGGPAMSYADFAGTAGIGSVIAVAAFVVVSIGNTSTTTKKPRNRITARG